VQINGWGNLYYLYFHVVIGGGGGVEMIKNWSHAKLTFWSKLIFIDFDGFYVVLV
jgi:hypothetical protein